MSDADVAFQSQHVALVEHIADQAVALAEAEVSISVGQNACGILTSMFTAIMGTRAFVNLIYGSKKNLERISI